MGSESEVVSFKRGWGPSFAPDGKTFATCRTNKLYLYDTTSGRSIRYFTTLSHAAKVVFSPRCESVVVKSTSGRMAVFSLQGELLHDFENQKEGEGCRPVWTPDGSAIIDGSWKGTVFRRDARSGEILATATSDKVDSVNLIPDGRIACTRTIRGNHPIAYVEFRNPETLELVSEPRSFGGFRNNEGVSPHGEYIWAIRNQPAGMHFDLHSLNLSLISTIEIGSSGSGRGVEFAPDNSELTLVVKGGTFARLRLPGLEEIASYSLEYPCDACYSSDGRWLVLASWGKGLVVNLSAQSN